ncbi:MAG: hypothetical protein HIU87_02040 [Acidobacteria bacterium]|nr:hypothetical protein [Acidobacteriota bacterium]
MKFINAAFFLALTTSLTAQVAPPSPSPATRSLDLAAAQPTDLTHTNTAGCPVHILRASFAMPGRIMPVAAQPGAPGNLQLQYSNASGKDIRSICIEADMLVKHSIYDLDATTVSVWCWPCVQGGCVPR